MQVSPPWGLPSRWGETSPPAPGRAKSCTQDHRFPPPAGDAQADHTKGAAMPPDQAIPLSPRAVLGLCPFATGTASLWAPQPGAAPHPQPGAGCPFPLTCFHILQPPPTHWVPTGYQARCPPPLLSPSCHCPPAHGHASIAAAVAGSDTWCLKDFFFGGGHLILGTRVLGPDPAPGLAGIPLSPAQGGAGACQDCHPPHHHQFGDLPGWREVRVPPLWG